ncbi:MAG: nitroreductase family deazaflavin-dependent oxidoreductase [Chloroflexota bacterium]
MQRIAASKPGAWFYSRTLHHFDRLFLKLSGNRVAMTSLVAGLPVVILTSKGAKSGLPRTVPLLCIQDESEPGSFALIATNWGQKPYPSWYFNLKANPEATCSIAGKAGKYLAHEAQGEEYERFWEYALNTYLGYPLYKERIVGRSIPVLVMKPVQG